METEAIAVLMAGLGFLTIVGMKMLKSYNMTELEKSKHNSVNTANERIYQKEIESLMQSNKNYKAKIRKLRENYDVDYDDLDSDELEQADNEEFKLSELIKSVYPKLPPSISTLVDKDEFQNAIVKTVEKKPDIINTFIDKFVPKNDKQEEAKYKAQYL